MIGDVEASAGDVLAEDADVDAQLRNDRLLLLQHHVHLEQLRVDAAEALQVGGQVVERVEGDFVLAHNVVRFEQTVQYQLESLQSKIRKE